MSWNTVVGILARSSTNHHHQHTSIKLRMAPKWNVLSPYRPMPVSNLAQGKTLFPWRCYLYYSISTSRRFIEFTMCSSVCIQNEKQKKNKRKEKEKKRKEKEKWKEKKKEQGHGRGVGDDDGDGGGNGGRGKGRDGGGSDAKYNRNREKGIFWLTSSLTRIADFFGEQQHHQEAGLYVADSCGWIIPLPYEAIKGFRVFKYKRQISDWSINNRENIQNLLN
ncbi:hypothetical protein V1478_006360 [Vespula squamosa]|uniref:Uncharacterized protein n=1 Tax=Vespula squamosa TaxID=30214 RepID=A0ABD2B7L8_VESSQ